MIGANNPIDSFTASPASNGTLGITLVAGLSYDIYVVYDAFGTLTAITSLTDTASNAYAAVGSPVASVYGIRQFKLENAIGGPVTATAAGNGASVIGIGIIFVPITGANPSGGVTDLPGNVQDPVTTAADFVTTNSASPPAQPNLVIALTFSDQTGAAAGAGTGMTLLAQPTNVASNMGDCNVGYKRTTLLTSQAATFTSTTTSRQITVGSIFLEDTGPPPTPSYPIRSDNYF